jgi:hypothetical protein
MARTGSRSSAVATHNVGFVKWNEKPMLLAVRRNIAKSLRGVVQFIRNEVRTGLSGPAGSPEGGPPGKVDGDLISSIGYRVRQDARGITATVGVQNDPVQFAKGARLAGGFVGRDRDGRYYSQGERPWLAPVFEQYEDMFLIVIAKEGI